MLDQSKQIENLMYDYYKEYYHKLLGLPDWKKRITTRFHESESIERLTQNIEEWVGVTFKKGMKVLVVGGGTGAEHIALLRKGCEVYSLEPNKKGVEIARLKIQQVGGDESDFLEGTGEKIPFPENTFDFIWCYTVIEHVRSVRKTISEMVRALKPLGAIFLETPDYRHFYEPHYKIQLPLCLGKTVNRIILKLRGRSDRMLSTINFVTSKQIANIIQNLPVTGLKVYHSWPESWKKNPDLNMKLVKFITKNLEIQRDQYWIIKKLRHRR